MFRSFKKEQDKKVSGPVPPKPGPIGLQVIKRDSSVQPFDKTKLVHSMTKAGATPQQAAVVSYRVVGRLENNQTVHSSQLSDMVARSLSRVNPVASQQYTHFRNQKLGHLPPRKPEAPPAVSTAAPQPPTVQVSAEPTTQEYVTTTLIATGGTPVSIGTRPPPSQQPLPPVSGTRTPPSQQPLPPVPGTTPPPSQQPLPPLHLTVSVSPSSATVRLGNSIDFTTTVTRGVAPYYYEWFLDSRSISHNPTFSLSLGILGTHQVYCTVRDSAGSTGTSNEVKIIVEGDPLSVEVNPSHIYVNPSQYATFSAIGKGGLSPYTYKWFERVGKGTTEVGTSSKLSISKSNVGTYKFLCVVHDNVGYNKNSNDVVLEVIYPLSGVTIHGLKEAPVNTTITLEAWISGGAAPYTYEWFELFIEGAPKKVGTSATLSINKSTLGSYRFRCRVCDSSGSTCTSDDYDLQVVVGEPLAVYIEGDQVTNINQTATLTAKASGGAPPYIYKWYEGSTVVGTSSTLSISKSNAGTYRYYLEVMDSARMVKSAGCALTVQA